MRKREEIKMNDKFLYVIFDNITKEEIFKGVDFDEALEYLSDQVAYYEAAEEKADFSFKMYPFPDDVV